VDAYLLDRHNVIPGGHTATWKKGQRIPGRNDYVKQHLPQVARAYQVLCTASRRARYERAYLEPNSVGYYQKLRDNEFATASQFFRQFGW
jgi:hypothetical protein